MKNLQETVLLSLGSNLGDRLGYIQAAISTLSSVSRSPLKISNIYSTPPIGPAPQEHYLNVCVTLVTSITPGDLLTFCKHTEKSLGRIHRQRWGSREIDIDIICYGCRVIKEPGLAIPHSQMHLRQFVLVPLADIAPDYIVPDFNKTVSALLNDNIKSNGLQAISQFAPAGVLNYEPA